MGFLEFLLLQKPQPVRHGSEFLEEEEVFLVEEDENFEDVLPFFNIVRRHELHL